MIELSMRQVLWLWSQLQEARLGVNSFGGDTAMIPALRLLDGFEADQVAYGGDEDRDVAGQRASRRLFAVLRLFDEMHDVDVRVEVGPKHDGMPVEWLLENPIKGHTYVRLRSRILAQVER